MVLLASSDGRDGSLKVRAPVEIRLARLAAGSVAVQSCCLGQRVWMQVVDGDVDVNGVRVVAGDAAVALNERRIELSARGATEVLLVALPSG
jgi:redox-sensitive bicupin YhaK (pirin superfamily)